MAPDWTISVEAIPRKMRHAIHDLLLNEGLPKVRLWLFDHAALTGQFMTASLAIIYDEEYERLEYEMITAHHV